MHCISISVWALTSTLQLQHYEQIHYSNHTHLQYLLFRIWDSEHLFRIEMPSVPEMEPHNVGMVFRLFMQWRRELAHLVLTTQQQPWTCHHQVTHPFTSRLFCSHRTSIQAHRDYLFSTLHSTDMTKTVTLSMAAFGSWNRTMLQLYHVAVCKSSIERAAGYLCYSCPKIIENQNSCH